MSVGKKGGEVPGRIHGKPQILGLALTPGMRSAVYLVNWDEGWQGGDLTATSTGRKF